MLCYKVFFIEKTQGYKKRSTDSVLILSFFETHLRIVFRGRIQFLQEKICRSAKLSLGSFNPGSLGGEFQAILFRFPNHHPLDPVILAYFGNFRS